MPKIEYKLCSTSVPTTVFKKLARFICTYYYVQVNSHQTNIVCTEVGIYKRKQESKKTRKKEKKNSTKKAIKKKRKQGRKQELDQESDLSCFVL